jgi:pSer/pThr/pTyr-binding forkhead associated (FHA) protein
MNLTSSPSDCSCPSCLDSHFIVANGTKSMKVVLELQEQLANVRRVTVRHDIVIGRGSDCNLRLSAPQMSRRHCFLRVGRDGVSVTDLDSSNGTYVDNKRIKPGASQRGFRIHDQE